jgi:hypothetical protein
MLTKGTAAIFVKECCCGKLLLSHNEFLNSKLVIESCYGKILPDDATTILLTQAAWSNFVSTNGITTVILFMKGDTVKM